MRYYYYLEEACHGNYDSAIKYSVPLIVSALRFKELKTEHMKIRQNMITKLLHEQNNDEPADRIAWLFGRLLYSSKISGYSLPLDFLHYSRTKQYLEQKTQDETPFDLWGKAYFTIEKNYYESKKNDVVASAKLLQDIKDRLWVNVLMMNSAAEHSDKEFYNNLKQEVCDLTQESQVNQAIKKLPYDDYQGWALSLLLSAETRLCPESDVKKEIVKDLKVAAMESKSTHDIALIEAYQYYLKENLDFKEGFTL